MIKCSEERVCNLREKGGKWEYSEEDKSLVKEFNLICEDKVYLGAFGAVFFIGQGLAGLVWSIVSDAIGRKKTLMITMVLCQLRNYNAPGSLTKGIKRRQKKLKLS